VCARTLILVKYIYITLYYLLQMYTVLLLFLYYENESIEFLEKNIALISIFVMDKAYFIIYPMHVLLLAIFQLYRSDQFYWWRNSSTLRKSPTCRKVLGNFNT